MKVVILTDKDMNEITAVYTLKKFLKDVNKEYYEANNFNGKKEYFDLNTLDFAMDWFLSIYDNLAIDIMEVETSVDDEV